MGDNNQNYIRNFYNCIVYMDGTTDQAQPIGFGLDGHVGTYYDIRNCIVYGVHTSHANNDGRGINYGYAEYIKISNTTVYDCDIGYNSNSSEVYGFLCKNCIGYNNDVDFAGMVTAPADCTNNLSKDGTAPPYNTFYTNKTLTFANVGTKDFHLAPGDTDAINKGVDLSATFTTDIDGQTRPTGANTWDIGADEYVSAGPGSKNYSKGNYAALPTTDTDLENYYTEDEISKVGLDNGVFVEQTATSEYAIHQFRDSAVGASSGTFTCKWKSNLAPFLSIVKLQIYKFSNNTWEDLDSDNTATENEVVTLQGVKADLTNYKSGSDEVVCRVWQLDT
jgi:hypothetical protein